jgi:deoxyribonuclease V
VAKTPFTGEFAEPGRRRGDWSPLIDDGEVVGRALRTQTDIKPVYVSVGHRIGLEQATALTLTLAGRFRLPETIRAADSLSRRALRDGPEAGG